LGKLKVGLVRFLPLCALLLVLPSLAASQPSLFTFERVWTTDDSGNDKNIFNPGDAIHYRALIRNTSDHPVNVKLSFYAYGPLSDISQRDIYTYSQSNISVPVGLAAYFSPWTIPASAQPGRYSMTISICWNETHPTPDSSCSSGMSTGQYNVFDIPGYLSIAITTFLPDGVTPASAAGVGPGDALVYKITVTSSGVVNDRSVTNTGVILTDPLPREIFAIITTPTSPRTDHGTCSTIGSWPSTTLACLLGRLGYGETATISFMASIIVRNPDGTPSPPDTFVNKVYVRSDQQTYDTSVSVETLIRPDELKCKDFQDLVGVAAVAAGVVVGSAGPFAGFVWEMVGGVIPTTCQPKPAPEIPKDLVKAIEDLIAAIWTKHDELIIIAFDEVAKRAGLKYVVPNLGNIESLADALMRYRLNHNQ
jgi:hypothetical protein